MHQANDVIVEVAGNLERLGLPYVIGGSIASIVHGEPRLTRDVDFVVDCSKLVVTDFVRAFESAYYVDRIAVERALANRSSFNMIHLGTMLKVDIFVSPGDEFSVQQLRRRCSLPLRGGSAPVWIASPEDTVLAKLRWYRKGGESSSQQWRDILGVLKEKRTSLDIAFLSSGAATLRVDDLLQRAMRESGLAEPT